MLAGAQRGDRDRRMQKVRQTDAHHIDVGILNQFLRIGVLLHVAEIRDHPFPTRGNQIRDRDDLESTCLFVSLCVLSPGPSAANDACTNRHGVICHWSLVTCQRPQARAFTDK